MGHETSPTQTTPSNDGYHGNGCQGALTLTSFSESPLHLLTIDEAHMLKNVVLHSVATALANIVLPVPVEGGRGREGGREREGEREGGREGEGEGEREGGRGREGEGEGEREGGGREREGEGGREGGREGERERGRGEREGGYSV